MLRMFTLPFTEFHWLEQAPVSDAEDRRRCVVDVLEAENNAKTKYQKLTELFVYEWVIVAICISDLSY